jgi:hypothetical protein
MTGATSAGEQSSVDAELRAVKPPHVRRERQPRTGLFFSTHARERMGQRHMTGATVYAIWRYGEISTSGGCLIHRVTDRALHDCDGPPRKMLQPWSGAAIIVRPADDPKLRPVLVTVLADGKDTYFNADGTANDVRRGRPSVQRLEAQMVAESTEPASLLFDD